MATAATIRRQPQYRQHSQPTWPEVLSIPQVARYLAIAEVTVRRLLTQGTLPGRKVGASRNSVWRVRREDLEALFGR